MVFILKWNPDISSTKLEDWEYWIRHFPFINTNWSVFEHETSSVCDLFYMVKVGSGTTGVVAKGKFCSQPYRGSDWSGKGREVYYRDIGFFYIMHPDMDPVITTDELEQAIPWFDWREGHSGVRLADGDVQSMDALWENFIKANAGFIEKQDMLSKLVIEPSALERIKHGKLWETKVCPHLSGNDPYTENATHDCVNLKFSEDYAKHVFYLDVLFGDGDVILKIECRGLCRIKMDIDNGSTFMSDFSVAEAGPKHMYLRSNGIELWCTDIEFQGTGQYDPDSYPVTI